MLKQLEFGCFTDLGSERVNIPLDFTALKKNRNANVGVGLDRLARINLEPGIYLMAGFYRARNVGHCVVLEVFEDRVYVHEDDGIGGVESLDWLHEITYIRRFKLKEAAHWSSSTHYT